LILVDSSVWIDYFTGKDTAEAGALHRFLANELVAIGDLMLVEVLQGFRSDRDYRKARQLLLSLTVLNLLDTEIALKSADNFRRLRARGITVRKTVDAIIATYCIETGMPLLSADRDFKPFHDYLKLKDAASL
jgi:predicted nucleic acid-binding protein